jgi:hypothetical protein
MAFCYFPHRLVPFDTHSRTWFIHYFPAALRRPLYRRFATQEPEHYEGYLNFKTKGYHVRTALKYFSRHEDKTAERLRNFKYAGEYAGNNFLRAFADKLMRLPLAGGLALSLVSALADADLHFYK